MSPCWLLRCVCVFDRSLRPHIKATEAKMEGCIWFLQLRCITREPPPCIRKIVCVAHVTFCILVGGFLCICITSGPVLLWRWDPRLRQELAAARFVASYVEMSLQQLTKCWHYANMARCCARLSYLDLLA